MTGGGFAEGVHEILDRTTKVFRKGAEVAERDVGDVHVTEVFAFPPKSEAAGLDMVDCHFVTVGVDKARAEEDAGGLAELMALYPEPERLAGGPSYIEVGAVLGDQTAALRLFALGQVLGIWKVITPATMHITGREADELAGGGFVMCTGWRP